MGTTLRWLLALSFFTNAWAEAPHPTPHNFECSEIIRSWVDPSPLEKAIQTAFLARNSAILPGALDHVRSAIRASVSEIRETRKQGAHYKTTPLRDEYVLKDQQKGVLYYSKSEISKKRIQVRDGKIYDTQGVLVDSSHGFIGTVIYAMDDTGEIYITADHEIGKIHHSSLLAGKPAAGAGTMKIQNGVITELTASSGHYTPKNSIFMQVIERLDSQGANLTHTKIYLQNDPKTMTSLEDPLRKGR